MWTVKNYHLRFRHKGTGFIIGGAMFSYQNWKSFRTRYGSSFQLAWVMTSITFFASCLSNVIVFGCAVRFAARYSCPCKLTLGFMCSLIHCSSFYTYSLVGSLLSAKFLVRKCARRRFFFEGFWSSRDSGLMIPGLYRLTKIVECNYISLAQGAQNLLNFSMATSQWRNSEISSDKSVCESRKGNFNTIQ